MRSSDLPTMPLLPISLMLALAMLAATLTCPAEAAEPPRVLGATIGHPRATAASETSAVRQRAVQPNVVTIEALARDHVATQRRGRFVLDLFADVELDAEVTHAELRSTGVSLFARLAAFEAGHAVLTFERGVLSGIVHSPGGTYAIEADAAGGYRVVQHDTGQMIELPPRIPFSGSGQDPAEEWSTFDVPIDSGRLIDVMIVWHAGVEAAAGSAAAMQSRAQQAVDHANLVYLNSGIAQRLRLVHAQQVSYTERATCPGGTTKWECALDDVTDGLIPNVHALRDAHGADLVSLFITGGGGVCGIGWLPFPSAGTAGYGFSVLEWNSCPVANMSFVHELGHNMGAHHDPYVAPGPGAYAYSHGMIDTVARWRDVMSYNNQCSAGGFNCSRIPYMSNPRLAYNGSPLGDASTRNNSHTLNKTAKAVAAYRPTSALHPVPPRFSDVATTHPLYGHIDFLAQAGVSSGCAASLFCPDEPVTRRQMAVFIERAMKASNWIPPAASGVFADVPPGAQFRDHIEALRNDGITTGCTATTYCPDAAVTRAQMAVFVLRASCGASYLPNPPTTPTFADVATSHPFFRYIEKLYALGITGGCASGPLRYCPDSAVTRAQMAAFVERIFPLDAPTEACTP